MQSMCIQHLHSSHMTQGMFSTSASSYSHRQTLQLFSPRVKPCLHCFPLLRWLTFLFLAFLVVEDFSITRFFSSIFLFFHFPFLVLVFFSFGFLSLSKFLLLLCNIPCFFQLFISHDSEGLLTVHKIWQGPLVFLRFVAFGSRRVR